MQVFKILLSTLLFLPQVYAAPNLEALLDVRPSWAPSGEDVQAQNEIDLFYHLDENFYFGYVQEFQLPLYSSSETANFSFNDGYIKTDQNLNSRFRIETRTILPMNPQEQLRGMNAAFRPIIAMKMVGDASRGIELSESVIGRWYRNTGAVIDEVPSANVGFENRMELTGVYTLLNEKVGLKLPLVWQWKRYSDFSPDAENNAGFSHVLWINPEVLYAWTDSIRMGAAYYSESFLSREGFDLLNGLEKGTVQFVVQASL